VKAARPGKADDGEKGRRVAEESVFLPSRKEAKREKKKRG